MESLRSPHSWALYENKMNVVETFKCEFENSMSNLSEDEWAVTKVRDNFVNSLNSQEAFSVIIEILDLATLQTDQYAFDSYCWLIDQLAEKSNTTEQPDGLNEKLINLKLYAQKFGNQSIEEVVKIVSWYRITNII